MKARTPVTYVTVAAICLLLHNVVLIISDHAGVPLWLAVLISFCLVASVGYVLHGVFTFRQPLAPLAFARYAFAMSANIPIAFITTWVWHDLIGLEMPLAAPLASLCMLALNFALGRWAIMAPGFRSARR